MNSDTIILTAAIKLTEQAFGRPLYAVSVIFESKGKSYTYVSSVAAEEGSRAEVNVNGEMKLVTVVSCELASAVPNKLRVVADRLKSLSAVYTRVECDPLVPVVLAEHAAVVQDRMAKLLLQELGLHL